MIAALLRDMIGLNAESLGKGKLDADVNCRMEALGLKDQAAYESLLRSSKEEQDKLIALVTIPETWFFRAYDSFIFLEEFVRAEWMPKAAVCSRPLRVLSIPSSTGEEPYSIAMTMLRCGLAPSNFVIDAADINPANLDRAARGVYTKNSFRSELQWFKDIHFTSEGRHFILDKQVRDCVSFHQWNLLDLSIPQPGSDSQYDIVFCRNLLIYFDEPSQRKALEILSGAVKDNGLLFLGHAESTSILFGRNFVPVDARGSFAFKKTKPQDLPPQWDPTDTQKLLRFFSSRQTLGSERKPKPQPQQPAIRVVSQSPAPRAVPPMKPEMASNAVKEAPLDKARAMANRGLLKEAAELCKAYVDRSKLDPEGYFLLGVLLLSLKRPVEAENFLNKTLFLKPDHSDALLRLAALKEGRGDRRGAELCRRRAGRTEGAAM